jgi:putative RNA 2'-phosphotransferase
MSKVTARSPDVRVSKFLSLVLRHEPSAAGVTLDAAGWVDVATLLAGCAAHGVPITPEQLAAVVAGSDKQRFAFSDDRKRIRANQGHSVPVELGHANAAPPAVLYHGTPARNLDAIRREGLRRMGRHDVHLSEDAAQTLAVGQRRGPAVLLTVRAADMAAAGHLFRVTPNRVWLTEGVPTSFIEFPEYNRDDR